MSILRIFNPEHDLALAFGGANYTPPPMARLLKRDLQMLPMWFGNIGDFVLSQDPDINAKWASEMNKLYDLGIEVASVGHIADFDEIQPWGWNKFLQRRLFLDGAKESALKSDIDIDNIRRLSHRRISIEMHRRFLDMVNDLQDLTPIECSSLDEVLEFARRYPCAYTKAPWSSSGKGIYRALDIDGLDFTRWCSGIIKRQGSIMCERPLNVVLDFAMEYKCVEGVAEFIGYSIFNNDTHSSFTGGLIGTTEDLQNKIIEALGNERLLHNVREASCRIIDELISPYYEGFLGIDMMIYRDEKGGKRLNPCIELNLRTTMGVVSSIIGNRMLADAVKGTFHVDFHKMPISDDYYNEIKIKNPLQITDNGKIKSGVQFLTPPYKDAQYSAYIKV